MSPASSATELVVEPRRERKRDRIKRCLWPCSAPNEDDTGVTQLPVVDREPSTDLLTLDPDSMYSPALREKVMVPEPYFADHPDLALLNSILPASKLSL